MKESLRFKVFRMSVIPIVVAVVLFVVLGIYQVSHFAEIMEETNREQNTVIMDTMSDSMLKLATESFQKYVVSEAKVLNGEFWTMRHDLEVLAKQVKKVIEKPEAYSPAELYPPSEKDEGSMTLQLVYSENAVKSEEELDKIRRVGSLGNMMMEIVEGGASLVDCVVSLPSGISVIADRTPESKLNADGKPLPFNAERRPWYAGALVHGTTYFTPVNKDTYHDSYQVMVGVPVIVKGELAAVCGGSIRLEALGDIITAAKLGDYTDTCLINENGNLIFSSRTEGELMMSANELKSLKESSNAELVSLVNEALSGDVGFSLITVDGEAVYVAYAPMETVGWTQLLMISQEDLNRTAYLLTEQTDAVMQQSLDDVRVSERKTMRTILIIAAVSTFLAIFLAMLFSDSLVKPIKRMTERVSEMQGEDMTFEMEDVLRTGDEIEVLAQAFADMSDEMRGYVSEIVEITAEKQRLDTELSVAAEIQTNMLPNRFPAYPDRNEFDLYAVMDPAREVGGDFYDFFLIDRDHLALVVADVSGKGVPAALFMVVSKTLIKNVTLSGLCSGPAEILADVNNRLCEGNDDSMFVTAWLGILTISTGELVAACAGHEYPVFYRKDGGFTLEKDKHGMVMGAMGGMEYKDSRWKLDPGDMVFLYTDGVPEAHNGEKELFGTDRMMTALEESRNTLLEDGGEKEADLREFLKLVRRHIDDFAGDTPQFDDLTMLCLDYRGDR